MRQLGHSASVTGACEMTALTVSQRAAGGRPGEGLAGMPALVRMLVTQLAADHAAGLETAAFVSGYPGSPLGGLDQELARQHALLDAQGILHQPGLNEELAATAVFGSQVAAARPDRT